MKSSHLLLLLAAIVSSCMDFHHDTPQLAPRPYRLTGRIWQDSLRHDSVMQLWVDQHGQLLHAELPVVRGKFSWQGETNGIDELRLCDTRGHIWHMYGGPAWDLEVEIDTLGRLTHLGGDTVNTWLAEVGQYFDSTASKSLRIARLDSVCRSDTAGLRSALLLLREVPRIDDSIMVRRLLGSLSPSARPEWIVSRIDACLDAASVQTSGRLPDIEIVTPDTAFRTHEIGHSGKLYLFWAEWDSVSLDTMQQVARRIQRDYGLYGRTAAKSRYSKRMEIVTVCLSATDSARWKNLVDDVPGIHALYPAGFSDPRIRKWKISTLPYSVVTDAYGNIYGRGHWGSDLDRNIDRFADIIPKTNSKNKATINRHVKGIKRAK